MSKSDTILKGMLGFALLAIAILDAAGSLFDWKPTGWTELFAGLSGAVKGFAIARSYKPPPASE